MLNQTIFTLLLLHPSTHWTSIPDMSNVIEGGAIDIDFLEALRLTLKGGSHWHTLVESFKIGRHTINMVLLQVKIPFMASMV